VGIHDSRLCGTVSRHHLYHFLFLCKPLDGDQVTETPLHTVEVLETCWFAEHALPADLHPGHASRISEAFRVWQGDDRAYFDR